MIAGGWYLDTFPRNSPIQYLLTSHYKYSLQIREIKQRQSNWFRQRAASQDRTGQVFCCGCGVWLIPPSAPYMRHWNGPSLVQALTITWTNAGLFSIGPLGTSFSEIWIGMLSFSLKECIWKCRLPKWRAFRPGGDELMQLCPRFMPFTCHQHDQKHYWIDFKFSQSNWAVGRICL